MAALRPRHGGEEEHDEKTLRYFARGHMFEEYVAAQLAEKHGSEVVERNVEIPWPLGIGHGDIGLAIEDPLLIEVKSTVTPSLSSPMIDMAVAQLKIYLRFSEVFKRGALYLINPSSLAGEDVIAVGLSYEDEAIIDGWVESVRLALEGGDLPERVCRKPGDGRGRLCPFIAPCFEGWEEPAPGRSADPEVLRLVEMFAALKREEKPHKEALANLEQQRKELQAELAEYFDFGDSIVGPWEVKRVHVQRSPSFKEKLARAAGFPMQTLEEFFVPGAEYDTWQVFRADEPGEIDYGDDVPF